MGGQFDPLGRRVGIDPSFMGLEAKQFGGRRVFTEVRAGGNTLFGSPPGHLKGLSGTPKLKFCELQGEFISGEEDNKYVRD